MKKIKNKVLLIISIIIALIIIWFSVRFIIGGDENSWIKDEKGIYVKHGNPAETPDYVLQQQEIISSALSLYQQKKAEEINLSSQCLGTVGNMVRYAVDIVSVPRTAEDSLAENQCEDYRQGIAANFIELDKGGNIVRII